MRPGTHTALMIVFAALLRAPAALAQQDVIDECREAPNDAERIACLEAALLAIAADQDATETNALEGRWQAPAAARAEQADRAKAATPAAVESEEIGARQVAAITQTDEEREASLESASGLRVASYSELAFHRLQITLENGQVWQQIKGDSRRFRVNLRRNQTVDIYESRLGGYKMRLNEMGHTLRVRRVR